MSRMWCSYCGSNAHEVDYCPKTWGGSVNRHLLRCGYCGSDSHNTDGCRKTAGGPNPVRIGDRR